MYIEVKWKNADFELKNHVVSLAQGDEAVDPKNKGHFWKNVIFCHLHLLKLLQDLGHVAKKMRFQIPRLPSSFLVQSEATFGPPPASWKVTDRKNRDFLFFKKVQLKDQLLEIRTQKIFLAQRNEAANLRNNFKTPNCEILPQIRAIFSTIIK